MIELALDSELLVVFGGSDDENPCIFACYQGIWVQRRVRSRLSLQRLDAELGQRPSHLGQLLLVDLATGLRGREVVTAPVGIERAEQPVPANHLVQPAKAREASPRPYRARVVCV